MFENNRVMFENKHSYSILSLIYLFQEELSMGWSWTQNYHNGSKTAWHVTFPTLCDFYQMFHF